MSHENLNIIHSSKGITNDVKAMIEQTRDTVSRVINTSVTLLYWRIGKRIQTEILQNQRAEYGKQIIQTHETYNHMTCSHQYIQWNVKDRGPTNLTMTISNR